MDRNIGGAGVPLIWYSSRTHELASTMSNVSLHLEKMKQWLLLIIKARQQERANLKINSKYVKMLWKNKRGKFLKKL